LVTDHIFPTRPERLEPDALLEAIVEVRFQTDELAEITVGKLTESEMWGNYRRSRLPIADIPQPVRDADPVLRFAPIIEMVRTDGLRAVKIGGKVISYHITKVYPGWSIFRPEIHNVIAFVDEKIGAINFVRIGFRYVNVFSRARHSVAGFEDTKLAITLSGHTISEKVNLNYIRSEDDADIAVKIATPGFVSGPLPSDFSLFFDIDLSTKEGFVATSRNVVEDWVERAHAREKEEFFDLLTDAVIAKLTPEGNGAS
jgi:uncharacterized protein (TIGR04255 family)